MKGNVTKYELYKRCLNCGKLSVFISNSCSYCNMLFIGEATTTEIKERNLIYKNARNDYEEVE